MAVIMKKKQPIVARLPKKQQVSFAPDNETHGNKLIEDTNYPTVNDSELILDLDETIKDDVETLELTTHDVGVTTEEDITCSTKDFHGAPTQGSQKVGTKVAYAKSVPKARAVEYGGEVYPSLTKCLKALGLCRDRFKYLKRTRKELRTDKAIIGIMVHERRAEAMQGTSYVIAIKGEVCFEKNLTAACTRVNQILQLTPDQALTQGQVSKYRYEHNKRPKNRDHQITLYEAFTSCLARLLVRHQLLEDTDRAIFKARMATVSNELNKEEDILEVIDDDDSHLTALSDLITEYNKL